MKFLLAQHLGSGREAAHWPKPNLPEYAFIGRSNVGKSSFINMLCGIGKLARVSNTPGRTRNVEHFRVEGTITAREPWLLADLPGYGFAKISKSERALWQRMIHTYLRERENLQLVFLLIDVRLEPQRNDQQMIQWLGENGIPFAIVFTKADKLGRTQAESHVARYRKELQKTWENLPRLFLTSSETAQGREEVLAFVDEINRSWGA